MDDLNKNKAIEEDIILKTEAIGDENLKEEVNEVGDVEVTESTEQGQLTPDAETVVDENPKEEVNEEADVKAEESAEQVQLTPDAETIVDENPKEDVNEEADAKVEESTEQGHPYSDTEHVALDDTQRVRVLSPGMLVFKRFVRSKLAVAGSFILIFMFMFSFLGAWISPYAQKEKFYAMKEELLEYALATERTEYTNYYIGDHTSQEVPLMVRNMMNSNIKLMVESNSSSKEINEEGTIYEIKKLGEGVYSLCIKSNPDDVILISSVLVFDLYDTTQTVDNVFKAKALNALYGTQQFAHEGINYKIKNESGALTLYTVSGANEVPYAIVTSFVVRRYTGEDTLSVGFKRSVELVVSTMKAENSVSKNTTINAQKIVFLALAVDEDNNPILDEEGNPTYREPLPLTDEFGNVLYEQVEDDEGNIVNGDILYEPTVARFAFDDDGNPIMEDADFLIERKLDNFVLKNYQTKQLLDIYSAPSGKHLLGTDGNAMDVLTRIMYGGQISLMVGFVVIILELIIGIILGGIAGYFGKWVDNIIMRLVDIFNCIPSLPIMVILGSMFDALQMDPYMRLMWLMVVLGVLGWPGVARLVRGQILSLREQEFMIAAEATGLSAKRRIFRHLIPNVMPQLIVTATMGLGGIIITESTLSFLGLGAKYPLATWGYIINSVSSAAEMVSYTYIWIPVGLLICLTVIAFNFVGDGLRDAFDPKMKR